MPSLADAMNAQPGPESLAHWLSPPGARQSTNVEDRRGERLDGDSMRAARLAAYLDQVGLGHGDKVLAGIMSMIPGRMSYKKELALAQYLQAGLKDQDPASNLFLRGAGLISPTGALSVARAIPWATPMMLGATVSETPDWLTNKQRIGVEGGIASMLGTNQPQVAPK